MIIVFVSCFHSMPMGIWVRIFQHSNSIKFERTPNVSRVDLVENKPSYIHFGIRWRFVSNNVTVPALPLSISYALFRARSFGMWHMDVLIMLTMLQFNLRDIVADIYVAKQ